MTTANPKRDNPKDVIGSRKLSLAVLPFRVLTNVALAMLEGALKYGRHNYRAAGVRASVYFDAVVGRHLMSWWEGEDIDAESNLSHIDKAIAGLMVLRDSMLEGNWVDDRPPAGNVNMKELNDAAAALYARYGHINPKHYTIADRKPEEGLTVQQQLGFASGGVITGFIPHDSLVSVNASRFSVSAISPNLPGVTPPLATGSIGH